jgi:hypothetical protein
MRKQYHSRQVGKDTHIWDVHRLIRLAQALPVQHVPLANIAELDENWWYQSPDEIPTPRAFVAHMKLLQEADTSYPVILCSEGRLMDGMHRIARALLDGRRDILAYRFETTPPPDFINVSLDALPYPDEEI